MYAFDNFKLEYEKWFTITFWIIKINIKLDDAIDSLAVIGKAQFLRVVFNFPFKNQILFRIVSKRSKFSLQPKFYRWSRRSYRKRLHPLSVRKQKYSTLMVLEVRENTIANVATLIIWANRPYCHMQTERSTNLF